VIKVAKTVIILVIAALMLSGCASNGGTVIATVNEEEITEEELNKRLEKLSFIYQMDIDRDLYGEEMLDQLIEEKLLLQKAEEKGVIVGEEEVEVQYSEFESMLVTSYSGEEELKNELDQRDLDLDDFRNLIGKLAVISGLIDEVTKDITVSEQEIKDYYDENPEEFVAPESVEASHILVEERALAEEILEKLDDSESFSDLAKEHSIDTQNKDDGGHLGYFTYGEMVPEFEQVAFDLEIDQISEVVATDFGYHIIKVTDRVPEKMLTFNEAEDFIRDRLLLSAQEDYFQNYVEEAKTEADIART